MINRYNVRCKRRTRTPALKASLCFNRLTVLQMRSTIRMKPDFTNINQPKYKASHCNDEYLITIDTVKVELVKQDKGREEREVSPSNMTGENEGHEQQQPNAIKMAEMLKDKEEESLLKK